MKQSSLLSSPSLGGGARRAALNGHAPHGRPRTFDRGSFLFLQGDQCTGVFVLKTGRVKLSVDQSSGRTFIVGIAQPGDIVGLAAAVAGSPYQARAEALEPCEGEFVTLDEFHACLNAGRGLASHAMRQMSLEYLHVCGMLSSLADSEPVIVRLARLLAAWAAALKGNGACMTGFTHQQIAEMIATTRETVTRALSQLRARGLATLKNGELIIHDHERLLLLAANGTNGHGRL